MRSLRRLIENVEYCYTSKWLNSVIYSYDTKAEISEAITPVFSVTWTFRSHDAKYFGENSEHVFQDILMNRKFKITFIWNRNRV